MTAPVDQDWVAAVQSAVERPNNVRLRLVNGALLMVPVTTAHFDNGFALGLWARSIPGVRGVGEFALTPRIDGYTPEPDFALVPEAAHAPRRTSYRSDEVLFIAEIVSSESEQRDYVRKNNHYAKAGIPTYLVLDVLTAEWTLFTEPQDGTYTRTCTGPFGSAIPVTVAGEPHPIDSGDFAHL